MATTTTSPSPNSTTPSTPNPRTPDTITPTTRKTGGSRPSASEAHRRYAGFKSSSAAAAAKSLRASFEHKENEGGLNHLPKPAAPPFSSARGAKNFTAATISAASKAIAASPRRKILADKNDVVVVQSSLTPDDVLAKDSPEVGFSVQRKVDLENKNHRRQSGSLISFSICPAAVAPSDADPSLPPYDPHINYLSPRPRFLHYRPNPRIEQCLHKDAGLIDRENGKHQEYSFSTESCEDTLGQIEEEHSSNPQKDYEEESSSSEVEVMERDTDGSHVHGPVAKSESNPKSSGNLRHKFAFFLLVLVIACVSGSFWCYSVMSPSMLTTPLIPAMSDLHVRNYIVGFSVNLKELARRMGLWSFNAFDYYTFVTTLPREEFGTIYLANLTASTIDEKVGIDYSYTGTVLSNKETSQGSKMEQPFKGDTEEQITQGHEVELSGEVLEDGIVVYEAEKRRVEVIQDLEETERLVMAVNTGSGFHEDLQEDGLMECVEEDGVKEMELERRIDGIESEKNVEVELRKRQDLPHDPVTEHVLISQDGGSSLNYASQFQSSSFGDIPLASDHEHEISSNPKSQEFSIYGSDARYPMNLAVGLLSLVLLLQCFVFLLMKREQISMVEIFEIPPAEVVSKSVSASSERYGPCQNTPVDMLVADSGPKFSSNLQHSLSAGQWRTIKMKEDEALSHEGRLRDSAVSSPSISYGSFTTYEKLAAKKGTRDKEVMTPLRRSSRIRNQIASP